MKTHKFDGISFLAGFVVTVVGLLFLIPTEPSDVIDLVTGVGVWFWPLLLVAIGVAVIVPVLIPTKTTDEEAESTELE